MKQLASSIKHYLKVVAQLWQISLKELLEYRLNILVQGGFILFYLVGLYMMLEIIFTKTSSLGGWSKPEILLLYGISGITWGFTEMLYFASLARHMTQSVARGDFDMFLTKPLDAQFLACFMTPRIQECIYPISSGLFTWWILFSNHFQFTLVSIMSFGVSLLFTQITLIFLFSGYSSIAFFVTRSEQVLKSFQTLGDHSQYPATIYPQFLKIGLLSFLGISLIAYVPTSFLLGKLSPLYLVPLFAGMCITIVISRFVWKQGLRRYASASS